MSAASKIFAAPCLFVMGTDMQFPTVAARDAQAVQWEGWTDGIGWAAVDWRNKPARIAYCQTKAEAAAQVQSFQSA